jgi:hypothetical protein
MPIVYGFIKIRFKWWSTNFFPHTRLKKRHHDHDHDVSLIFLIIAI